MACPQTENKLMGTRFPMHGVMNHVLLKQKGLGLGLAKPKPTLYVGAFCNHTLAWLPKVIKRISLGMKLSPQMSLGCPKSENVAW